MKNPTYKVTVNATGREIEVYRLKNVSDGKEWCDFADCNTLYLREELTGNLPK